MQATVRARCFDKRTPDEHDERFFDLANSGTSLYIKQKTPKEVGNLRCEPHHPLFDGNFRHISLEGLFLNADSGFDAKVLRADCFRRGIEANIAWNPRSRKGEEEADS